MHPVAIIIREARQAAGLSRRTLAAQVGLPVWAVEKVEAGCTSSSLWLHAPTLAAQLGVELPPDGPRPMMPIEVLHQLFAKLGIQSGAEVSRRLGVPRVGAYHLWGPRHMPLVLRPATVEAALGLVAEDDRAGWARALKASGLAARGLTMRERLRASQEIAEARRLALEARRGGA